MYRKIEYYVQMTLEMRIYPLLLYLYEHNFENNKNMPNT